MTPAVEQLVRETMELTGADRPSLLEEDSPVLSGDVVRPARGGAESAAREHDDGEDGFYLVGLIGGKEVGKSALVNALVGKPITAITSHGPGTEIAVAYAHRSQEPALRELLEREVPGRFRIVTHDEPALRRQVLLDLPDIDSHYQSHLAVTRTMLRHMLYPVWVQSVEKYADLQPQQMLSKVASGNDPRNFVFCLNKVDQLGGAGEEGSGFRVQGSGEGGEGGPRHGDASASASSLNPKPFPLNPAPLNPLPPEVLELRDDFAARLGRTLSLASPPEVYLISARSPARFDLPRLRGLLCREKSRQVVRQGRELAGRRQDKSLLDWLARQDLAGRAARLDRLRQEAEELAAARLAVPLVEQVLPRLTDDPASRQALADEVLADRVARWPLVNLVHTLLAPLFVLIRTMGAKHVAPLQGAEATAEFYLRGGPGAGGPAGGWPAAQAVQSTFAALRQSQPVLSQLYVSNKFWEDLPADVAAADLSRRLAATIERQRAATRSLVGRGGAPGAGLVGGPLRWLLTVGALLWFPIVQPVLEKCLNYPEGSSPIGWHNLRPLLGMIVSVLGTDYLLKSAGFLAIYFLALWLSLRWSTQRKVARLAARWRRAEDANPELNLATQALQWVDDLTDPIRRAHERMASLAERAASLRAEADKADRADKAA